MMAVGGCPLPECPMHQLERIVLTDENGYREVTLPYRIARAGMLDTRGADARSGRIACPGLDASRNNIVYGRPVLPGTEAKDLEKWSSALGVNSLGIKTVAYLSGPFWSAPLAFLRGRFDDRALNTGFLRSMKRSTNTGILTKTSFNQDALNRFVWAARPDLRGTSMTSDWLYSDRSACQYIDESMLPLIRDHNARNTDREAGWLSRQLGLFLSTFEMHSLLLGTLAQPITTGRGEPAMTVNAIQLRDLHDLYKYGIMPAAAEERLFSAGLLAYPVVYFDELPPSRTSG
ncbi:hypothetical protein BK022_06920 [Methylorubrum extorquens]|uniref:Uncharacterized protein n=1 Tax=Methylorubrum extorquens TaxID=408 RepID=A0A1S1P9E7_METEX|nr:hypothetical protein BK022_06920 [Methylorubrum extorquens]